MACTSPSQWAPALMHSSPSTFPSPCTVPPSMSAPGVSMSPTSRVPLASSDGVPPMRSSRRRRGVCGMQCPVRGLLQWAMSKKVLCWNALALSLALALAGCSHEGADWKSATAADTSEAYQQFLTQHPNSTNAVQARTRIQQLQEDRDWQAATAADTRDAYEQFLTQHADSKWAQEARIRIENFAQSNGAAAANAAAAVSYTHLRAHET